jgi:hypothetical protein
MLHLISNDWHVVYSLVQVGSVSIHVPLESHVRLRLPEVTSYPMLHANDTISPLLNEA